MPLTSSSVPNGRIPLEVAKSNHPENGTPRGDSKVNGIAAVPRQAVGAGYWIAIVATCEIDPSVPPVKSKVMASTVTGGSSIGPQFT